MPELNILHISDLHLAERPEVIGLDTAFWHAQALVPRMPLAEEVIRSVRGMPDLATELSGICRRMTSGNLVDMVREGLRPSSYSRDRAEALTIFARLNPQNVPYDLVALTGDIAATGIEYDLRAARDIVGEVCAPSGRMAGDPQLVDVATPIYAIPGNHDRFQDFAATPNGTLFDGLFAHLWSGGSDRIHYAEQVVSGQKVSLISVDFSLSDRKQAEHARSQWSVFGQGFALEKTRVELARLTGKCRERRRHPVVWLMHFPPFEPKYRDLAMIDWGLLEPIIRKFEVDAILCGHLHEPVAMMLGGTYVHCAGSACAVGVGRYHYFHHLQFETRHGKFVGAKVTDYVWDGEDPKCTDFEPRPVRYFRS